MVYFGNDKRKIGRRKRMKTYLATAVASAGLAAFTGVFTGMAVAHHSFAMFDHDHPMDVVGTVKEFRYTSPHTFIILEIKDKDDNAETWNLEGGSPSAINRDGWTAKSIKAGDVVRITIEPLRSGAPGGAWSVNRIRFLDGRPVVPKPE
jgi:hypothetical protein